MVTMLLAAATSTTVVVEHRGATAADWLTAIGTLGAAVVALGLGLGLRTWVFSPRLRLAFSADNPSDRLITLTVGGLSSAWVRPRVKNAGRGGARRVRVSVVRLERWRGGAWERAAPEVTGAEFEWSNRGGELAHDIPPGSERPLDLFSILRLLGQQGQIPMTLAIGPVQPANRAHQLEPGGWRIAVELGAENSTPRVEHFAFRFDGNWPAGDFWRAVAITGPSTRPPDEPPVPELRDPVEMLNAAVAEDDE